MPRLSNEAHEIYARHYAQHSHAGKALKAAGLSVGYAATLAARPEIQARIVELNDAMLKASDITAQRVMLELGRVAFADVRKVFRADGTLIPIHELDDDAAASIAGIEHETKYEREGTEEVVDLVTGEVTTRPRIVAVRTAKIKRYGKDAALTTLAKHFKIVGDEGDGVNALASALADRLKSARTRVIKELPDES